MPSTNGYGPKRAILYARVSTDEQAKSGFSIPGQLRELRVYTEREGLNVVEEIVDDGYSGSNPDRPVLAAHGGERGHANVHKTFGAPRVDREAPVLG